MALTNRGVRSGEALANTKVEVGTSSTVVVGANRKRVTVALCNDGANTIYISKGNTAAVLGQGIRLNKEGGSIIIEDWLGEIRAIASTAATSLTVCEV